MAAAALHSHRAVAITLLRGGDAVARAALVDLHAVAALGFGGAGAGKDGHRERS